MSFNIEDDLWEQAEFEKRETKPKSLPVRNEIAKHRKFESGICRKGRSGIYDLPTVELLMENEQHKIMRGRLVRRPPPVDDRPGLENAQYEARRQITEAVGLGYSNAVTESNLDEVRNDDVMKIPMPYDTSFTPQSEMNAYDSP